MPPLAPTYARSDLSFARGEGAYLFTVAGERYLDFASGVAVTALGHAHPHLVRTLSEQAKKLWHVSNLHRIPEQERLAERLCAATFADMAFFANSGAEAVECAIKAARRYHFKSGAPDRYRLVTFEGAFHGRTLATIAAGGQAKHLEGFGPPVDGFDQVAGFDLAAVENAIGASTAGILIEPIMGEGGMREVPTRFLQDLRALADAKGILLLLDEVQTGMGRTGRLWGYEHAGVAPDVMTLAKALANGVPIGATLATDEVAAAFGPGSHGSTFGGNPFATAVGLTVLTTLLEERLPQRADRMGRLLLAELDKVRGRRAAAVKAIRGRGCLVGIDLVPPVADVLTACRERGLLVLSAGDNTLRLAPSLVLDESDVARGVEIIESAVAAVAA
jgi:acetylornithine/N-succinyldiaminopimelate aminotransferase